MSLHRNRIRFDALGGGEYMAYRRVPADSRTHRAAHEEHVANLRWVGGEYQIFLASGPHFGLRLDPRRFASLRDAKAAITEATQTPVRTAS